jgi:hypothetical protein
MKALAGRIATVLFLMMVVGGAQAAEQVVKLSGAEEVPAVTTDAVGTGTLTIGADGSVSGTIHTKGVAGTMSHIHLAEAGKNGPIIIPLIQGSDGEWTVPPGAKLTAEQYAAYKAGNLYVNVHSAAHPGGEIRAQLKPKG